MNKELQEYLLKTLKQSVDFTLEQAPIIAKEMLIFDAWEAKVWLFIPVLVFLAATVLAALFGYLANKSDNEVNSEFFAFLMGTNCLIVMGGFIFIIFSTPSAYFKLKKIETAPKYYLIEKLQGK